MRSPAPRSTPRCLPPRRARPLLLIALAALAVAPPPAASQVVAAPPVEPGRWAQDYTGRPADPAIRFGTLPNGLRYAIMHNTTPQDGVAMRLRIGSGAMMERDDELGLAHVLEHMAFRGSANIPDGEVVQRLEREGLRFGPDTNAGTGHTETVYQFTFPHADAAALDTGLTLFREIGERLTLSQPALDAERGVVLSEERLRDTPGYQAEKADLGNALAGTRVPLRWPIGTVATITSATPQQLRRFYSANYRPDNAIIVIVGNIDVAKVEAEVIERFADWRAAAPADQVDFGTPAPAHPAAEFTAPGAPDRLTLAWVRPRDRRAETEAVDREQLLQLIGLTILNNRLADRAGQPGSPYVAAQAGIIASLDDAAGLTQISITAALDKWAAALGAVTAEQRQILAQGVSEAEIKRATTQLDTLYKTVAANAPTRQNGEIADMIVSEAGDNQLITSPAQDLALYQRIAPEATPETIATALRQVFTGADPSGAPVVFRSAQSGPVGAAALAAALRDDYSAPLPQRAIESAIAWPYGDFGAPGVVTSRSEDTALGATRVTFPNGTRLIVKPTRFEKDHVGVSVALGYGRAGAPDALVHALWAGWLLPLGGTGKVPLAAITRWAETEGKVASITAQSSIGAFRLVGATRPADLTTQLQLLAAFARDPGFRPELADKLHAIAPMLAGQIETNAGAVFTRAQQELTAASNAGGPARFTAFPESADIAATRAEDLQALLKPALAGPADVTIVGDVTLDAAIAATASTFGAGDTGPASPAPKIALHMAPGRAAPYVVTHAGRVDQAFIGAYWPLPDYFADPRLAYVADVAAAILRDRLTETVREKMGLTYSPDAEAVSSIELPGQGYFGAAIETPPANFATFQAALAQEIKTLAAAPVSADTLARAKAPLIESRAKALETNGYWLEQLALVLRDPRAKAPTLNTAEGIKPVTAADVQALFAKYVRGVQPLVIEAKAKGGMEAR